MNDEVNISTWDEYLKKYEAFGYVLESDFSNSNVNQDDLAVLSNYFSDICTDFTLYMDVFSGEENIKELNRFNSFIFSRIERAYLERICLKIATLMDPATSGKKENLSLRLFIESTNSENLKERFKRLEQFYIESGIKDWRNKILAHADLKAMSGQTEINFNFQREDVDKFVSEIQEFIDYVRDPKISTDHRVILPADKNGSAFIRKLREHNNFGS